MLAEKAMAVASDQCLLATIQGELFAFDVTRIREILRSVDKETAPGAPGFVVGVINLRGEIVTVIDAAVLLGLVKTTAEAPHDSHVIVVEGAGEIVGVRVDRVHEVFECSNDAIEYPQVTAEDKGQEYVQGVYHHEDHGLVILLDIDALCRDSTGSTAAVV